MGTRAPEPKRLNAADLDDRQLRGVALVKAAERSNALVVPQSDSTTLWLSKRGNRVWRVERELRNRRGKTSVEYTCTCVDFLKNGRIDCQHILAERVRRGEIVVVGKVDRRRAREAQAERRPARRRVSQTGRSIRSVQRDARVALGERIPQLLADLGRLLNRDREGSEQRHIVRALALVFKLASGKSADEMVSIYGTLIEKGVLGLRKVPHQNTLSRWMNDERLTPWLEMMLHLTAKPFRAIERAGIVDSSKMSQMRSAHARWVEYGDDQRDGADWMKLHVIVGAESLVCMGAVFSGSRGAGTHDINFLLPLVEATQGAFNLRYVLADKAYLSQQTVGRLWEAGMQAVIPIKRRWDGDEKKPYYEVFEDLVKWYDERQASFHEAYRIRPKVEGFFSLVKRVATDYCWSRGRPRKDADGTVRFGGENADGPCTAWRNETLCKLIYVNLRRVVEYELLTGYEMNLLADTFFPPIPDEQRLIA